MSFKQYPKEFIETVTFDFKPVTGQGFGGFERPMIASIPGISIEVERSYGARNQLKQRNVALAGLFAAWNKLKEQSGEQ
jgi:hypothetical protein